MLAFGAGALISAVSFELAEEGLAIGGAGVTGLGLARRRRSPTTCSTALIARAQQRPGAAAGGRAGGSGAGTALALGAFLDGIPEQAVLGINLAAGNGVGVALLVAIFVSNLPEAMGSADDMRKAGTSRAAILRLWLAVAAICTLATVAGYLAADAASGGAKARDRRLRRRRAAGDADRLDDPRRPGRRRAPRRPGHRPRIRRRRRASSSLS